MFASTILTLTIGLTLPLVAAVAMPIIRFSDTRDQIAVATVYFTHILTMLTAVMFA